MVVGVPPRRRRVQAIRLGPVPAVVASAVDLSADIYDSEMYAPMRVSHQKVPARCSRLQLRKIEDIEKEAASEVVERLSAALSAKISKASD